MENYGYVNIGVTTSNSFENANNLLVNLNINYYSSDSYMDLLDSSSEEYDNSYDNMDYYNFNNGGDNVSNDGDNESSNNNEDNNEEGLSKEFNDLSNKIDLSKDLNKECYICHEKFKKNESLVLLYCSHYFHYNCIFTWYKIKKNCPVCRLNVDIKENIMDDLEGIDNNSKIESILNKYLNLQKKMNKRKKTFSKKLKSSEDNSSNKKL